MSITPKKFNSVDINAGSYISVGNAATLNNLITANSQGYLIELTDYFVYISIAKGYMVIRKSDSKILYTIYDTAIRSGAKIDTNTIVVTRLSGGSSLTATVGVVNDTTITFTGNELVLTTSWLAWCNTVVPVLLENGKIIIAAEYYTGSATPYTVNPVLYSMTVAGVTLTLYETKVLTSPGTCTDVTYGYGINLYKADTNRCIILTGVKDSVSPGKVQLITVTTGAIVIGAQTVACSGLRVSGGGTTANEYAYCYCPFSIICDDPNYIIISTMGRSGSYTGLTFSKIKLLDMSVLNITLPTDPVTSMYLTSCSYQSGYFHLVTNGLIYICSKNLVITSVVDNFVRTVDNIGLYTDALGYAVQVVVSNFIIYRGSASSNTRTIAVANAGVNAAISRNVINSTMTPITLLSGEPGKLKYVTSIIMGLLTKYSLIENEVQILLNGKTLFTAKDNILLPNSPIILADGDVLTAQCFMGIPRGSITLFGYETTI